MRFSALKILTEGLTGNRGWGAHWRDPEPAEDYDIIIIGGGGHGLATAYYLAKEHGLKKIAVLEKGYIGSGSIGRNTTMSGQIIFCRAIRSFTRIPLSFGKVWRLISITTSCIPSEAKLACFTVMGSAMLPSAEPIPSAIKEMTPSC
jgi:myosin-crossreactive antigen